MFQLMSLLAFISVSSSLASSQNILVCYYGTWVARDSGLTKYTVNDVDTNLCTHVLYAFVGIDTEGRVISLDPELDLAENGGQDNFRKFTALKNKNPKLKTLLSVGGFNEGSAKYSAMAGNSTLRKNFIQSALKFVQDHYFDGFDVDWEYPARRNTVHGNEDINNFSQLLKELCEEFEKYGLLVTAAVSAVEEMALLSYDIPTISKYLHFVHVMTYDLHGPWDDFTGHNAALHKGDFDEGLDARTLYTVDVAVEFWLRAGCPPEKLIMGIPLYGHSYTLADASKHDVKAPATGEGSVPSGYNELCVQLKNSTWTIKQDVKAMVPYAYRNHDWVSYDNPASIVAKVQFAKKHNLGGIMVWSIETDDFRNLCGEGKNPLLTAIKNTLRS